jgi:hypothetical protein
VTNSIGKNKYAPAFSPDLARMKHITANNLSVPHQLMNIYFYVVICHTKNISPSKSTRRGDLWDAQFQNVCSFDNSKPHFLVFAPSFGGVGGGFFIHRPHIYTIQ